MSRLAICFGQFGPYHHARVAALQKLAREQGARVVPVQIASDTATYEWKESNESRVKGKKCEGLKTLCTGVEEKASPLDVFLKARKLFREEGVDVAFLPSYSPARYFALFAAAKSLGIRTVMMNESHAGTEQATGWKRWIKRQVVKRFDAAFVGGQPHKRHFASLGITAEKIFTGYDAVDNALFAAKADEVRSIEQGAWSMERERPEVAVEEKRQEAVDSGQGKQDHRPRDQETKRLQKATDPSTLNVQHSTAQSFRSAYGLPKRYFLSLGRMVEKKNLVTLIAAYGRYCDEWRVTSDESARQAPASLVFIGSGKLEGALREQARALGLRVVDRTGWGPREEGKTGHGLTQIDADKSERLAADRTEGNADGRMTSAADEGPQQKSKGCELTTDDSIEKHGGGVFFYGFRQIEENAVFYALAEAFVLPSLKEEWGLVVNEAMAAGLPVIVSRTAGCAEDLLPASGQVTSGEWQVASKGPENCELTTDESLEQRCNGFVFDPTSSDALSEALRRIADQETKRLRDKETSGVSKMGKRSREIVAKFSCENFAVHALRAAEAAQKA